MSVESVAYAWLVPPLAAWVAAFAFAIRVTRHARKLEAPPRYIQWNPMNLVVRPDLWTPEARRDCMALFISAGVFMALVLVPFVISIILV